jgi:hypothetical protein
VDEFVVVFPLELDHANEVSILIEEHEALFHFD